MEKCFFDNEPCHRNQKTTVGRLAAAKSKVMSPVEGIQDWGRLPPGKIMIKTWAFYLPKNGLKTRDGFMLCITRGLCSLTRNLDDLRGKIAKSKLVDPSISWRQLINRDTRLWMNQLYFAVLDFSSWKWISSWKITHFISEELKVSLCSSE